MKGKRIVISTAIIILILISYMGVREYSRCRGAEAAKNDLIEQLTQENTSLKQEVNSKNRVIFESPEEKVNFFNAIEEDLQSRGAEIIKIEPVLGGNMYFTQVNVVNNIWAYGAFEDGHISGYGLYEYTIQGNGDIVWKVIIEKQE